MIGSARYTYTLKHPYSLWVMLVLSFMLFFTSSCRKEEHVGQHDLYMPKAQKTRELQVPGNFNWSTTRIIPVYITVNARQGIELFSVVSLYKSDPASGGEPVTTGAAGFGLPYETDLLLPSHVKSIWIRGVYPDG